MSPLFITAYQLRLHTNTTVRGEGGHYTVVRRVYLFLLTVEELSGEELVLVLLVSETTWVLKIFLPGTVRVLLTVTNTGACLGCRTRTTDKVG